MTVVWMHNHNAKALCAIYAFWNRRISSVLQVFATADDSAAVNKYYKDSLKSIVVGCQLNLTEVAAIRTVIWMDMRRRFLFPTSINPIGHTVCIGSLLMAY